VKLAKFRKPKTSCFLFYAEYKYNIKAILYIHRNIYRACNPKVGLVEETKRGGKEGKKDSKQ
jgi:hypothetical protein